MSYTSMDPQTAKVAAQLQLGDIADLLDSLYDDAPPPEVTFRDAYTGANVLPEGNTFKGVSQPSTDAAAKVGTFIKNATSGCTNTLGCACIANSVDSASGELGSGSSSGFVSTIKSVNVLTKLSADEVIAHVKANAGPVKLTTSSKLSVGTAPTTTVCSSLS